MTFARVAAVAALALAFAGCTEKPQTAGSRKHDSEPWQGTQTAFTAPSWKAGDEASWESQMRARAQSQNEYQRTAPGQK